MKNLRNLLLLTITLGMLSCSDENANDGGPSGASETTVKYVIITDAPIITGAEYRLADGTYAETDVESTEWTQTLSVERPFNASLFAHFTNNTTMTQEYSLRIYVNDQLMETEEGFVAPSSSVNDSAVFDVPR